MERMNRWDGGVAGSETVAGRRSIHRPPQCAEERRGDESMGRKDLAADDIQTVAASVGLVRSPSPTPSAMHCFSGGTLVLVTPSDNAWRSKNYNMLIKDQRLLSEMASLADEGSEWDTSISLPPSTFRAATAAGLLDNTTLEKLGLGHLIHSTSSGETLKSTYSSSLLIDTKSIISGEESSGSFGRRLSSSDRGSDIETEGFVIPPTKLAKALRLLNNPPIPTVFGDEEEMLQVYQLIYDALRYRIVFDQTLEAISFFEEYPKLRKQERVVHILFFDLQQRYFLSRDSYSLSEDEKGKDLSELIFEEGEAKNENFISTVKKVEDLLWDIRIHLAASVARLRIKRHAFYLIHLLPEHLRGPSHLDGSAKRALSLWINNFLIRKDTVDLIFQDSGIRLVEGDFLQPRSSSIEILEEMSYFYDNSCMNLMFCHPFLRDAITHSQLVKENRLVIQDRSFCVGPALLCSRLSEWGISGSVVQTHISSVRVTAYLASLLNEYKSELAVKPEVVLAFGAGERKTEYEASLEAMGITNVIVYSEPWIDIASTVIRALVNASANYEATYPNIAISPDFTYSCIPIPIDMEEVFEQLDNVVAVYATPPNTYSAVPDPVELAVSRGGDMTLLEEITRNLAAKYEIAYEDILRSTDSKEDQEYLLSIMNKEKEKEELEEKEKLIKLNKEQWEVLSLCLSLPQTQVVVYETHSMKTSENKELVDSAVNAANSAAMANFKKYIEEKNAIQKEDEEQDEQAEIPKETTDPGHLDDGPQAEIKPHNIENVIPMTDLFEVEDIPNIKETSKEDGCNISLIKRKEFVLLNNRYLIQMADARGLFGKKVEEKNRSPSDSAKGSKQKRKIRTFSEESDNSADFSSRPTNRNKEMEIERISAPTVASLRRSRKWSSKRIFKIKKEEECELSSDDDFEKYVCGRCMTRGEDECYHSLKMEGGRVVHPKKNREDKNSKMKVTKQKNVCAISKEKLLERLAIPTEVSLLRRNITWKEYKAKLQEEMLARRLGNFSRESSLDADGANVFLGTRDSNTGVFSSEHKQKNFALKNKYEILHRPVFSSSNWEMGLTTDNHFEVKKGTISTQIVDEAIRSTSGGFGFAHSIRNTTRGSVDHADETICSTTPSARSLKYVFRPNVTPQSSEISLDGAVFERKNDYCKVDVSQIHEDKKITTTPADILSLDEEEGQLLVPKEAEKCDTNEKQRLFQFPNIACVPSKQLESKTIETSGNNSDESNKQICSQADEKQIKVGGKKVHPLKSKLIKFLHPRPRGSR